MFPNLYYACQELFSIDIPLAKVINTAGLFVALAFIPAAWLWKKEMKRREREGALLQRETSITITSKKSDDAILMYSVLAFVAGYKLLYIFNDHQNFTDALISFKGNWLAGIVAMLFCATILSIKNRNVKKVQTETHNIKEWPHETVTEVILIAALSGVAGSKISGMLESPQSFVQAPLQALLSSSGFSFYGGLVLASCIIWFYYQKRNINPLVVADCMSPAFMVAYAVGRMGCQLSGDGDWGISNLHAKPFNWLPDWLWAYDYPHNVIKKGVYIPDCTWDDFCYHLAAPVYPTPVFEAIISILLFLLLWILRKRLQYAGQLWAVYLFLNGVERFFIEKIRVNISYTFGSIQVTQAEIFALLFIITGLVLFFWLPAAKNKQLYY